MTTKPNPYRSATPAFSRVEALALIAAASFLFALQAPLVAAGRQNGQLARCLANLASVQRAWTLYAVDHGGRIVSSGAGGASTTSGPDWVVGTWIDFSNLNPANWQTDRFPESSPLRPYLDREMSVFRCPADPARIRPNSGPDAGIPVPRTRSISLNNWVGGPAWGNSGTTWRHAVSLEGLVSPGPAQTFTFIDEREDSINDGFFALDMGGFLGGGDEGGATLRIVDFPADWHNRGASVAFADGHVEVRRWRDDRTMPAHTGDYLPLDLLSPNNADVTWLQERAPRAVPLP